MARRMRIPARRPPRGLPPAEWFQWFRAQHHDDDSVTRAIGRLTAAGCDASGLGLLLAGMSGAPEGRLSVQSASRLLRDLKDVAGRLRRFGRSEFLSDDEMGHVRAALLAHMDKFAVMLEEALPTVDGRREDWTNATVEELKEYVLEATGRPHEDDVRILVNSAAGIPPDGRQIAPRRRAVRDRRTRP